ncbi:MFS transporter [Alkalicoccus halolimnae]|uniref:MFS transporter n=1 Tax=Alkalicoccus halolimnae TaxID=1667239 RepID=A0A5C7F3D3_9BACI|nr:MFS transporter [Alkalicoccus halolimnae]TXF83613.1 MFS transporter [Alkalicoccus halolimnae]
MLRKESVKGSGTPSPWLQSYVDSSEKQKQVYKKTLIIVTISQVFAGAGFAAGITVGALLAQDMMGATSGAGLPTTLFTLGAAMAALLVGRVSQRFGRRTGLTAGFLAGGIGALGVIIAAVINSVFLLFLSLFIYGAGGATNLQSRYAGTDLADSKQRGKAISVVLVAMTFGAVAGPNLVEIMGGFALNIGVPALAGPFILAAAAYIIAGLVLFIWLRPDPFLIAKASQEAEKSKIPSPLEEKTDPAADNKRGIFAGAAVMFLTQFVMIAIMTMTPIHMGHYGHALSAVGFVIGFHIGAMFLPSLVTGYLVDKIGRGTMVIASSLTLLAAGLVAALGTGDSMFVLVASLALLGLGWNFGLISGTAILVDATSQGTRAKTQGTVDVWIALAGALGGGLSGVVVAQSSYAALGIMGALLSLLLIPIVIWYNRSQNKTAKIVSENEGAVQG